MNSRRNLLLYIVVFVFVVGSFVSIPIILKNVNADTESSSQNRALIFSSDFAKENTFDNVLWNKISDGNGNQPDVLNGYLNLATQKSGASVYNQISQKIDFKQGKIYEASINYKVTDNGSNFKAEAGFILGPAGEIITVRSLALQNKDVNFKNYFSPVIDYPSAQFFIKVSADKGTLQIKNISIYEMEALPSGTNLSDNEATKSPSAVSTTSVVASETPAITSTPIISETPSAIPTSVPSLTATSSPTPISSATPEAISSKTAQDETDITFKPGWNIVGFSSALSTADFTNKNLYAYQMLNNKWISQKAKSKESFILNESAGVYIYNPTSSEIEITAQSQTKASDNAAGKKWNIFYNDSDSAKNISELNYQIAKNGKMSSAKSYNLATLVNDKNASNEVYILKQTEHGVALNKIDLNKTPEIPAKSSFWLYIFDLPK
ncbi:MAG: hypothetical protein NTZ65_03010 [Candidatus Berkelbacteria bacterium]|nr:hypothetical protein [Candidatus Berkelbacteria bacterium]